tara:strand:+ start:37500 stop:38027 length:528 start_codon:yes stop_codon:yes gene_type:complete
MTRGINKVILIGNLGQSPETRYHSNGDAVTRISIATSDIWKDKNTGQTKERTEWHRVVLFGKVAEFVGNHLAKGSQVYIEGRLQTRKWIDQSGQDKYTTEVVVDYRGTLQALGGMPQSQQGAQSHLNSTNKLPEVDHSNTNKTGDASSTGAPIDFDDDIPFAPIGLQYKTLCNCI